MKKTLAIAFLAMAGFGMTVGPLLAENHSAICWTTNKKPLVKDNCPTDHKDRTLSCKNRHYA